MRVENTKEAVLGHLSISPFTSEWQQMCLVMVHLQMRTLKHLKYV